MNTGHKVGQIIKLAKLSLINVCYSNGCVLDILYLNLNKYDLVNVKLINTFNFFKSFQYII